MLSPRALRDQLPYKWVVAAVFVAGLFIDIMDTTIVNVALKTMADDLGSDLADVEWIVLGYLVSLAVWIPASGWIGDRFGTKRVFLLALFVFTVASALCGLATSLPQLIAFRVLQGVGGGMLTPVGTAMLFRAFPPAERTRARGRRERVDRTEGARSARGWSRLFRGARVVGATHRRTDPCTTALSRADVPQRQHRAHVHVRELRRCAVPRTAVPAGLWRPDST